jgi:TPP-dependent pyruvate/acetoin dehydrogenase alpha subunit
VDVTERPSLNSLYLTMKTIRRFEERVVELVNANEIAGVTHEYVGQEAVATGICAALRSDDVITSTHRGHGHVIAKGADIRRMMAELLGRVEGLNRGRGGSMHIADVSLGIYGANGIVAAGVPFAAGAAWAAKQAGIDRVAVCFFGDGGLNQGVLFETMNLASLWKLPVVFVCENNGYALTLSYEESTAGSPVERAASFGIASQQVDGMDVVAVFDAAREAVERGRNGGGPSFIECMTYRFVGHHTAEHTMSLTYRTTEEIESWRARDPLEQIAGRLEAGARNRLDAEVEFALNDAIDFARRSPKPDPDEALDLVYAGGERPRDVSATTVERDAVS